MVQSTLPQIIAEQKQWFKQHKEPASLIALVTLLGAGWSLLIAEYLQKPELAVLPTLLATGLSGWLTVWVLHQQQVKATPFEKIVTINLGRKLLYK